MTSADPNLHWDGQRWHRWDGHAWAPVAESAVEPYQPTSAISPSQPQPGQQQPVYATPQPMYPQPQPMYAQPQAMYGAAGTYRTDRSDKPIQTTVAWILTILTALYFLPWAIAATRGKSNSGAIGWINFLLGWTVVGWIIALIMACSAHQVISNVTVVTAVGIQQHNYPGYGPPPGY